MPVFCFFFVFLSLCVCLCVALCSSGGGGGIVTASPGHSMGCPGLARGPHSPCVFPSSPEAPRARNKRHPATSPNADSSPEPHKPDAPPRPAPKEGKRTSQEKENQDGARGREKNALGEETGGSGDVSPSPRHKTGSSKDNAVPRPASRSSPGAPHGDNTAGNQQAASLIPCGSIPLPKPTSPAKPQASPQPPQSPAPPPQPPDPSSTPDLPRPPQNGRHSVRAGRTSPPHYRR